MPDVVASLLGSPAQPIGHPRVISGYISKNQPAPTSFDDLVFVITEDHSEDRPYGPMAWPAIHGSTMPAQGAPCVFVMDQNNTPQLVWWAGDQSGTFGWINVKDYGATGDGVTDDTAAIQLAIAAIGENGGTLFFPYGTYITRSALSFDGKRSIVLRGVGGTSSGATPASLLSFNATSGSAIRARSAQGFHMHDLAVLYTSASFTGSLIDLSDNGGSGTAYYSIQRCNLSGTGSAKNAAQLVLLDNCEDGKISDCHLGSAVLGVLGKSAGGKFCNSLTIENTAFTNIGTSALKNADGGWAIIGCVFENLSGGGAGAYTSSLTAGGVGFYSCWLGDANTTGTWIDYQGSGLTVTGCLIGGGSIGVNLADGITGASITGNKFTIISSAAVNFAGTASDCLVAGNDMSAAVATSGSPPVTFASSQPRSSIVQQAPINGLATFGRGSATTLGPSNPDFETNTTGWAASGFGALNAGATLTRVTTTSVAGAASMQIATTNASASQGAASSVTGTFRTSIPYEITMWLRGNAGGELVTFGGADNTAGAFQSQQITLTTAWQKYSLTYTPTADRSNFYVFTNSSIAAAYTWFADQVQVLLP